jgi:bifunctional DNase/RNase
MSNNDNANNDTAIEMFVNGLVLDPNTQAPVVILKDEKGDIQLPIWIGIAEATSIASAIKQISMARPLTHDLMGDIFDQVGVIVQRVVITDLKDSTYYSELLLSHGDKAIIVDSRPSDAIAIALRASAPIFVTEKVLAKAESAFAEAGVKVSRLPSAQKPSNENQEDLTSDQNSEQTESQEELADQTNNSRHNFSELDKDKWNEILAELDPEDFKYKM